MGDLEERKLWDDYRAAYEDMLDKSSTEQAPWYVIPADRNWFRNLAVADIVADTLNDLKIRSTRRSRKTSRRGSWFPDQRPRPWMLVLRARRRRT